GDLVTGVQTCALPISELGVGPPRPLLYEESGLCKSREARVAVTEVVELDGGAQNRPSALCPAAIPARVDGAFVEQSGRNRGQPSANQAATETAQTSRIRCCWSPIVART